MQRVPLAHPWLMGAPGWTPDTPTEDLLQYFGDKLGPTNEPELGYQAAFPYEGKGAGSLRPYQPGRAFAADYTAYVDLPTIAKDLGTTTAFWIFGTIRGDPALSTSTRRPFSFLWDSGGNKVEAYCIFTRKGTNTYECQLLHRRNSGTSYSLVVDSDESQWYNYPENAGSSEYIKFVYGWSQATGAILYQKDGSYAMGTTGSWSTVEGSCISGMKRSGSVTVFQIGNLWDFRLLSGVDMTQEMLDAYWAGLPIEGVDFDGIYKLDESTGTKSYDSSGNNRHGTIVNLAANHVEDVNGSNWQNEVGFSQYWDIDKIAGGGAWANALALGTGDYSASRPDYEITTKSNGQNFWCGIGPSAGITDYTQFSHCYRVRWDTPDVMFFEDGVHRATQSFVPGDAVSMKKVGSTITFHLNNTLIYTGQNPITDDDKYLTVDSLYTATGDLSINQEVITYDVDNCTITDNPLRIPRNEKFPEYDADGERLRHTGRVPGYGGLKNLPCATFEGINTTSPIIAVPAITYTGGTGLSVLARVRSTNTPAPSAWRGIAGNWSSPAPTGSYFYFRERSDTYPGAMHAFCQRETGSLGVTSDNNVVRPNEEQFMAFTYNTTDGLLTLWVDGNSWTSGGSLGIPFHFDASKRISVGCISDHLAYGITQVWLGEIWDFRIYARGLSLDELDDWRHGDDVDPLQLILHYPLCEDQGAYAIDAGGNQFQGVWKNWSGDTHWATSKQTTYSYSQSKGTFPANVSQDATETGWRVSGTITNKLGDSKPYSAEIWYYLTDAPSTNRILITKGTAVSTSLPFHLFQLTSGHNHLYINNIAANYFGSLSNADARIHHLAWRTDASQTILANSWRDGTIYGGPNTIPAGDWSNNEILRLLNVTTNGSPLPNAIPIAVRFYDGYYFTDQDVQDLYAGQTIAQPPTFDWNGAGLFPISDNGGRSFDNGDVYYKHTGAIVPASGGFWFCGWSKIKSGSYGHIILHNTGGGSPSLLLEFVDNDNIKLTFNNDPAQSVTANLPAAGVRTATWFYWEFMYNSTTQTIQLRVNNGDVESIGSVIQPPQAGDFFIGNRDNKGWGWNYQYGIGGARPEMYNNGYGYLPHEYPATVVSPTHAWPMWEGTGQINDIIGTAHMPLYVGNSTSADGPRPETIGDYGDTSALPTVNPAAHDRRLIPAAAIKARDRTPVNGYVIGPEQIDMGGAWGYPTIWTPQLDDGIHWQSDQNFVRARHFNFDRFLHYRNPLTGEDLTEARNYTQ